MPLFHNLNFKPHVAEAGITIDTSDTMTRSGVTVPKIRGKFILDDFAPISITNEAKTECATFSWDSTGATGAYATENEVAGCNLQ